VGEGLNCQRTFGIISQENDFLGDRVQCIADLLVALFDDFRPGGNSIELAYKVGVYVLSGRFGSAVRFHAARIYLNVLKEVLLCFDAA
jgi:hypothetical protein